MRSSSRLTILSLATLLTPLLLGGHSVQAAFLTESATVSGVTDFRQSLGLAKFDPSLGTLQSVTISVTDQETTSGMLTNHSASAQSFMISQSSAVSVILDQSTILANILATQHGYASVGAGQSVAYGPETLDGFAGPYIQSTGLAGFLGLGTLDLDVSTVTADTISGAGGNVSAVLQTFAMATVTVRYDYAPGTVPEPSSWGLLAIGIAGAGAVARVIRK